MSRRPAPFPWEAALAFGLGVLRLAPENFWRTTPRELAAAWRGVYGEVGAGMAREELAELMRSWPDETLPLSRSCGRGLG